MNKNFSLISTKLRMPLPRKDYIKRHNLYEKLEGIKNNKITLLMGVAGSGKTTLITSFIQYNSINNFKWITLDKSNDDLFSFWNYFLEAIKDKLGQEKDSILSLFNDVLHKEDLDDFVSILVNQLDKEEDIILILDDFHYINNSKLTKMIEFFIKNSSDNIRFIILTREEPPIYLTDLLMSDKMLIINEQDLKLTNFEGTIFLKETLKINLDDATIYELNKICEGWVGGLQLMALASLNYNGHLIKEIKGLNKYVIDYLSKEILNSLNESVKHFLISTSILDYFDEDICNELLEISNSADIIAELTSKNLFIVDMGGDNNTFRYHNIFGEFLRLQFFKYPDKVKKDLQMRAATIFEHLGNLDKSIRYLFEIEEYKEAMRIIEAIGQNFKGWTYLSKIPMTYISENKEMAIQRIFYHFCNMEWEECKVLLTIMEGKLKNQQVWKVFNLTNALINSEPIEELDLIHLEEIEKMGFSDVTKAIIYLKFSLLLGMYDRYNEALSFIGKIANIDNRINNPYIKYFVLSHKSQIKEDLGELEECLNIYQEIFCLLDKYKFLSSLTVSSYIGIIGVYLKNLNFEKVDEYFAKLKSISTTNNVSVDMGYLFNLMEMKILKGENDEALKVIHKMTNNEACKNLIYTSTLLKYLLHLKNADFQLLDNFIDYYKEHNNKYIRIEDRLFYSRALYHNNQIEEALKLIDFVLQETRVSKAKISLVEALLFKIDILSKNCNTTERELLNLLREAIHYSYANNILSPYVLESKKIRELLLLLKKTRSKDLTLAEKNFINKVLKIIYSEKRNTILSNRELEVLYELATGASNKEIAKKLYISTATVKTHIIKIFSKLDATNRVDALEKGRSLELLI